MFSGFECSVERDAFDDVEPEALEAAVLHGVVGHEAHRGDPEVDQDLGADAVLAVVDRQAELEVGVDGVVALFLEVVGPQLVGQPDAATLVTAQVDDDAGPLLGDEAHGLGQLRAAVAAQGPEDVAGQAFGVDPHEHVALAPDVSPRTTARWCSPSISDS